MDQHLSKNIAFAYFSGYATPLQKKMLEDWLRDEKNLEQFYCWLEEWETEHPQFIPDKEKALQRYIDCMEAKSQDSPSPIFRKGNPHPAMGSRLPVRKSIFRWWMAAAVLIVCMSSVLLTQDYFWYKTYTTAYGEVKTLQLEDGSTVTLNAHSTLQVPRFGFGKTSREVFLQGEAEFVVTHTIDNKRFLVNTPDGLEVEVLGTEFVVKSRTKGSKVVLTKGKVQLKSLRDALPQPITMQPGDIVEVDEKGKFNVKAGQSVQEHTAWKEHRFVFDNTSLQEVSEQIHEIFGIQISIPDSTLAQRRIAGTYQAESAEELLQVLAELLNIQVSKRQGHVTLIDSAPHTL